MWVGGGGGVGRHPHLFLMPGPLLLPDGGNDGTRDAVAGSRRGQGVGRSARKRARAGLAGAWEGVRWERAHQNLANSMLCLNSNTLC